MNTLDLLLAYSKVARPIIREYFRADSCIASTAITIDVLRHFGIGVVPFPCRALIFNHSFANRIKLEGWPTPEQTIEWTNDGKSWSVGIGYPNGSDPQVGHLIAIVEEKYLVDASLDQASRHEKDLIVPSVMVQQIPRSFRRSQTKFSIESSRGDVVIYEPDPKSRVWLTSFDWKDKTRRQEAVEKILSKLI
jgi:hypothetical protein